MGAPAQFEKIATAIQEKLLDDKGGLIKAIQDTIGAPGVGDGGPAVKIATAIIVPIMIAELTFVGIRIAFKSPFVDEFARFTRILFIAYILVSAQMPQMLIRKVMPQFTEGGKAIGKELIQASGAKGSGDNPIIYWGEWLGDIEKDKENCKFHKNYIMKMFDEKPIADLASNAFYQTVGWNFWSDNTADQDQLSWIYKYMKGLAEKTSAIWTNMKAEGMTVELFIALFMPFMVLGMILTAIAAQMAGYIAPVFTQVAILVGSRVVLELTLALGVIVMPLIFFKGFENIWKEYLTFCASMALVPCFYYVLSGLGYAFSTLTFDVLFDPANKEQNLAIVFKNLYIKGLENLLPAFFGWLGTSFNSVGLPIVLLFVAIFSKLYFFVGGTVIVATFVAGGQAFAAVAPGVAGAWSKGFANNELMKKVEEFFTGVQGAVGSAVGQGFGQGISSTSNLIGGAMKGMFGK